MLVWVLLFGFSEFDFLWNSVCLFLFDFDLPFVYLTNALLCLSGLLLADCLFPYLFPASGFDFIVWWVIWCFSLLFDCVLNLIVLNLSCVLLMF